MMVLFDFDALNCFFLPFAELVSIGKNFCSWEKFVVSCKLLFLVMSVAKSFYCNLHLCHTFIVYKAKHMQVAMVLSARMECGFILT